MLVSYCILSRVTFDSHGRYLSALMLCSTPAGSSVRPPGGGDRSTLTPDAKQVTVDSDTLEPEEFRPMRFCLNALRRNARRTSAAMLVLSCVAVSYVVSAQSAPLTLVSTAWPPFTNPPGQPRFALDLVEAALSQDRSHREDDDRQRCGNSRPRSSTGRFDGSAAAWKDPERERALIYSQPYLENRLVLVGRHGADVSAKTLSDIQGKRVAIVEGYSCGYEIELAGPVFVRSSGEEDSCRATAQGQR